MAEAISREFRRCLKQPANYPLETNVFDDNNLTVVHASLYDDVDEGQISTHQRTPIIGESPFRKVYVESGRSTEGLAAELRLTGKGGRAMTVEELDDENGHRAGQATPIWGHLLPQSWG